MLIDRIQRHIVARFYHMLDQTPAPVVYLRKRRIEAAIRTGRYFITYNPVLKSKMIIDPQSFFYKIYIKGVYEPHLVRYLKKNIIRGMYCIDIGANVGYFTLLMARLAGNTGRVIAFEPTQHTCEILKKNIKINEINYVQVENIALFDKEGTILFNEGPDGFDVYNSAGAITHPSAQDQTFVSRPVPCTTLDNYLQFHGIAKVDIIKMDIEGAEIFALNGMTRCLEANPQIQLIIEFADVTTRGFGYSASDLYEWFDSRKFKLSVISPSGSFEPIPQTVNWVGQLVVASKR